MPRKTRPLNPKVGVPKKPIDWKQVDLGLMAGCSGEEIAADLGICRDTLYDRCVEEWGVNFSHYKQEKAQKGLSLLRKKQFMKAISGTGHSEMLKWLGVELLGQNQKRSSGQENLSDLEARAKEEGLDAVLRQPDDPPPPIQSQEPIRPDGE